MDLNKLFLDWNLILILIGCCSVISIAIFIERLMQLKKSEINTSLFIIQSKKFIEQGSIVDAVRFCDDIGGSIGNIVKAGLVRHDQSQERIEKAMELAGLVEISKLEKNAKILSVIAYIAPLIGLLGTVLGFIQAFGEMKISGLMDISTTRIGEAMEFALVTTAAGLVVAIPTVIAYNYLVSRIENLVLEINTTSSEIVDLIVHHGNEF